MIRAIAGVLGLMLVLAVGLAIYGYSVDMTPAPVPQSQNVVLDAQ